MPQQNTLTDIAKKLLATLGAQEFDQLSAVLDDDIVVEFPYTGSPAISGQQAAIAFFTKGLSIMRTLSFELTASYPAADGEFCVVEYTSTGETTTGKSYSNRYISVLRIRDGKVLLFREFFNPLAMAALR